MTIQWEPDNAGYRPNHATNLLTVVIPAQAGIQALSRLKLAPYPTVPPPMDPRLREDDDPVGIGQSGLSTQPRNQATNRRHSRAGGNPSGLGQAHLSPLHPVIPANAGIHFDLDLDLSGHHLRNILRTYPLDLISLSFSLGAPFCRLAHINHHPNLR